MFPFDNQTCFITLSSWEHNASLIFVQPAFNESQHSNVCSLLECAVQNGETKRVQGNTEWIILSLTATTRLDYDAYYDETYSRVTWTLRIQRRPKYYVTVIINFKQNDTRRNVQLELQLDLQVLCLPTFVITTLAIIGLFAPFSNANVREERITMG
jgi:hypothetical protein